MTASELLDVWERGRNCLPVEHAILLLAAACPERPLGELASCRIGQRDAQLLKLREWTFGPQLSGMAACPACGETLELSLDVAWLLLPAGRDLPQWTVGVDGYDVEFRLPSSLDVLDALYQPGPGAAGRVLSRCIASVRHDGEPADVDDLPDHVRDAVVTAMADEEPQADVELDLSCPACVTSWLAPFDIVAFFWAEIAAWAERTLGDVDALARAYGWHEEWILALTPWRRQHYLELAAT